MQQLHGNLTGLAPSDKQMLERIYRRRVPAAEVVTEELGHFLVQCSTAIKRQVGALIDRTGNVTHVIVGDSRKLVLPDLGRHRAGRGRLRGLRLIHTHLGPEPLTRDDLIDLAKLRLDLVGAIGINRGGQPERLYLAHLLPKNPQDELWRELTPAPLHRVDVRFDELIRALEEELARAAAAAAVVEDGRDRAVVVQVIVTGHHGPRARRPAAAGSMLPGSQGLPGGLHQGVFGALSTGWDPMTRGAELRELCRTAGLQVLDVITQRRAELDPRFLLGKGKLEEVVLRALQVDATLLVFDPELTPAQARAISDATELKVIDRTMLILDIFAQHAHSRDGKLQVELAQLKYALPRLIEKNTMMSRLTGGIGGRGPGETKLEVSRRRARERITQLSHQIDALSRERAERRKQRGRRNLPVVAIVGYTNAGKSTLLNTLTHSQVTAENKLFATLDPTSRRMRFPDERELILTDTVGFIRDLPEDLRAAFRATLEELHEADLMLHVIDVSDPAAPAHLRSVEQILGELGLLDKPRILVFNKLDRLSPEALANLPQEREAVLLAAADPETVRPLLLAMDQALGLSPERSHWQGWPTAATGEPTAADHAERDRYSTPGDLT
ncbi:MAG: GTPase HflX [Polyangia bacterium]